MHDDGLERTTDACAALLQLEFEVGILTPRDAITLIEAADRLEA